MARARNKNNDMVIAAAYLAGGGRSQTEIATILGIGQASVSRLLAEAENLKYLERKPRFVVENVSHDELRKARQRAEQTKLRDKLGTLGASNRSLRLTVFPTSSTDASAEGMLQRMERFSQSAAPLVSDLLASVDSCGVTWGGTLAAVANALQATRGKPARETAPVKVVPLCGERFGNLPTSTSASTIAEKLGAYMNGPANERLSLGMLPAYVPSGFTPKELDVIWRLIEQVDAYSRIFGRHNEGGLIHELDIILTGISAKDQPLGFGMTWQLSGSKRQEAVKRTEAIWSKAVIGDIAGVCLHRPTLTALEQKTLDSISERWTGLRLEHLQACAKRAMEASSVVQRPGVIVLAIGKQKAECIHAALTLGVVNHLVIDEELEQALEKLLV
jgi:DNA-binding transcriptional regulator LsrR (DeoR family)